MPNAIRIIDDHGELAGLSDNDHPQYALVAGTLAQFAATTSAQLAGVISDETGSGTLVFGTSPTFVTSIIAPKIIGGTGTTQTLTYQTTSGVGETGARHIFLVGNNGATEAMTILNSGFVGIGTTGPTTTLQVQKETSDGIGLLRLHINSGFAGDINGIDFSHYSNPAVVAPIRAYIRDYINSDWSTDLNFGVAPGTALTAASTAVTIKGSGNVGIGTTTPGYPLTMASGAYVSVGGVWTDVSSKDLKFGFEDVTILDKLPTLPIQKYEYKITKIKTDVEIDTLIDKQIAEDTEKVKEDENQSDEEFAKQKEENIKVIEEHRVTWKAEEKLRVNPKYLSPCAEDFNAMFGLGDDKSIAAKSLAGVALKGLQELLVRVETLENENILLKQRISVIELLITEAKNLGVVEDAEIAGENVPAKRPKIR